MRAYVIICTIIIILLGIKARGQGIGIEAGANFSNFSGKLSGANLNTGFKPGLRAGIVMDEYISEQLTFQYGAFYSAHGARLSYSDGMTVIDGMPVKRSLSGSIRIDYIEMPFSLQYRLMEKDGNMVYAGAGPYVALALGGLLHYDAENEFPDGTVQQMSVLFPATIGSVAESSDFTRLDYGLTVNVMYELKQGIYMRANAAYGLNNIRPQGTADNKLQNWGLSLTAGYILR